MPYTPPTANMVLRYRGDDLAGANGSAISSWPESSGQGHPAAAQATVANQPLVATVNGHKGASFDATNDFLSLSGTALSVAQNKAALTVYVFYSYPTGFAATRDLLFISSGSAGTSSRVLVQKTDPTHTGSIGGRRLDADASGVFVSPGSLVVGETGVLTACYVYSANDLITYKNGAAGGSNLSWQGTSGVNTSNTASVAAAIGANGTGTTEYFGGIILEILMYDVDHDASTRAIVHSYGQETYGLVAVDYLGPGWTYDYAVRLGL